MSTVTGPARLYDCENPCDFLDDPAWSPDGASIAACKMTDSGDGHLGSLVGIDVETGAETTLATFAPEDFCGGPRWSPDGSEISFELAHRTGTSLLDDAVGVTLSIVNLGADPPAIRPLTDPTLFASWGDWNPAGDLIVYSALPTPDAAAAELFTIRPDGSDIRQLTTLTGEGGSAIEPTFDLDGSSVVFVDEVGGSLRRVDLATGAVTAAFTTDVFGAHPRATPARVTADARRLDQETGAGAFDSSPAWGNMIWPASTLDTPESCSATSTRMSSSETIPTTRS